MSNFDDLVEFRNKLTNYTDYVIFEEDCQLLDRVLDDYEQKDQRIAELECDLENLTAYDLKKSHEYSIKILMQANENLSKQIAELKTENNEFCDYNKKLREEKQTVVKEFADEVLRTMIEAKNEYRTFLERQRGFYQNFLRGRDWISSNKIYAKIDKLLKERGIE